MMRLRRECGVSMGTKVLVRRVSTWVILIKERWDMVKRGVANEIVELAKCRKEKCLPLSNIDVTT